MQAVPGTDVSDLPTDLITKFSRTTSPTYSTKVDTASF